MSRLRARLPRKERIGWFFLLAERLLQQKRHTGLHGVIYSSRCIRTAWELSRICDNMSKLEELVRTLTQIVPHETTPGTYRRAPYQAVASASTVADGDDLPAVAKEKTEPPL